MILITLHLLGVYIQLVTENYFKYPSTQAMWYPTYVLSTNRKIVDFFKILLHRFPAKIIDFFAWCSGNPLR